MIHNIDIVLLNLEKLNHLKEVELKNSRPFFAKVDISNEYSAFIPFRTSFSHPFGFVNQRYKTSAGKTVNKGLDYTKSIIINNREISEYIISSTTIPAWEYRKVKENVNVIAKRYLDYVERYIREHKKEIITGRPSHFTKFSTLKNFHKELQVFENDEQDC